MLLPQVEICAYIKLCILKVVKIAYIITLWPLGRQGKILLESPCHTGYEILGGKESLIVMGLPLKDDSARSQCFMKFCRNHCDHYHETLFTEL